MKIIVDTREQKPLTFNHYCITEVKREKIVCGDYQAQFLDGYKPQYVFERKSIPDLFGTLSTGYTRFRKEITRAKENNLIIILAIEGSITEILKGAPHCERSGDEILQQLCTINVRYGVPFYCFRNREEMTRFITEFYMACGREYCKKEKELKCILK